MNREQKLEEAIKHMGDIVAAEGSARMIDVWNDLFAALSAPKAEAVEPSHWAVYSKTKVHIGLWRSKMVAEQAAEDYPEAIIIPLYTSPVPALTDEAVERMADWLHANFMMSSFHNGTAREYVEKCARASLLAAFPSKGG